MNSPQVSVIVPVDEQNDHLNDALKSILSQTYPHFEVIVVYAFTPDLILETANEYMHSQIKNISIGKCSGRAAAINAGIRISSGEFIAFLDANGRFHPEKLMAHVAFFKTHPDISITISGCYNVTASGEILSMRRYSSSVKFSDIVLGFPQILGEIVVRRNSINEVGLFDENIDEIGDVVDLKCRLALANHQFAGIDRTLNYYYWNDEYIYRKSNGSVDTLVHALESTFTAPRCPQALQMYKDRVLGNVYLYYSYLAFLCNETSVGQGFLRKSIRFDRSILDMQAKKFLSHLIFTSIGDGGDHQLRLQNLFEQLPPELVWITQHRGWSIAHGYIYHGIRAIMWGRPEDSRRELAMASELGAKIDQPFLYPLLDWVNEYEQEFGYLSAEKVIWDLSQYLVVVSTPSLMRWFHSTYFVNRAYRDYGIAQYSNALYAIKKAILLYPKHLGNRGVLSVLLRSVFKKHG